MRTRCNLRWLMVATAGVLGAAAVQGVALAQTDPGLIENLEITGATLDQRTFRLEITGTVTCSEPGEVFLNTDVQQPAGRTKSVFGYGWTQIQCDGEEEFTITVLPNQGRFTPGRAIVRASASFCTEEFVCDSEESIETVHIRGGRPR